MEDKRRNMKIKEDKGQKNGRRRGLAERLLTSVFFCLLLSSSVSLLSCSEEETEEDEFENWQERNDNAVNEWAANNAYTKILTYTKDATASGLKNSDYIYVEVLESGNGTTSPLYSDTCRVAYRGRFIPTKNYPEGYVFDSSSLGTFDWTTCGTADFCADSQLRDGFSTALQNMHIGDHWRVRFSYMLGYGTSTYSSIPAYSDLIFDIALLDFWHQGERRGTFKSRK